MAVKILLLVLGTGITVIASVMVLRAYTLLHAANRIYASADVPERPVAIIFGALVYPSGRPSHMLADRVAMGADLYHAGKVEALLMTGDNSRVEYNEPEAMRQYALNLGVPDEAIVLDYAGFRTYDSCYRARDIFQVEAAILVTQDFHLPRAILTCDGLGLDVVGVSADEQRPQGYKLSSMLFSQVRELPATTLAAWDLLRGRKPTYLGEPLPIFPE
ncbi:MAG: YdcF family protein [Anaerolineae bacterium]|nr:YdcF family protein [Anaerolineae bacterium]